MPGLVHCLVNCLVHCLVHEKSNVSIHSTAG